jgi:hypothetical protein
MRYNDEKEKVHGLRQEWDFVYQAAEVCEAAERQVQHHVARIAWWEGEGKTAEEELKKKGFEYRERYDSVGTGVQIVGDPELATRVASCQQKIREHKASEKQYSTWARALKNLPQRGGSQELKLKIDDILFFGL